MSTQLVRIFCRVALLVAVTYAPTLCREKTALDKIAEKYVKVALTVGLYQSDFIDAYFGPPEWRPIPNPAEVKNLPYAELKGEITDLLDKLDGIAVSELGSGGPLRRHHLRKHLTSLGEFWEILNGAKMTFDQESQALYDIVLPVIDMAIYDSVLQKLDRVLPGTGDVSTRLVSFEKQFLVPRDKLDTLMRVALSECRSRTKSHMGLPSDETVVLEFVANQPWWAYNWFKGDSKSLVQIDSSRDVRIKEVLFLAAHEGYPGHHVAGILTEKQLYRDSGWVEYSVYPLFCPISILDEGMANYALDLAFPLTERIAFYKSVLFPLAGLDTANLTKYLEVSELRDTLGTADAQIARKYIDRMISKDEAISQLQHYVGRTLMEAESGIDFFDRYRAYDITYVVGEDLVRRFVEQKGASEDSLQVRWVRFSQIITGNLTPSDLVDSTKAR